MGDKNPRTFGGVMKKVWYFFLICFCFLGIQMQADAQYHKTQSIDTKPVLVLYYSPSCPYSVKVTNYLDSIHKKVPMKNVSENRMYREELKRLGGKPQVPCLMIDGRPLYESDLIIKWLSDNKGLLDNKLGDR